MTELPAPTFALPSRSNLHRPRLLGIAIAAAGLVLATFGALALVTGLESTTISVARAAGVGLALVAYTALVVTRFDSAIALAIGATAVVFVEPAPTDGAFLLVLAVAAATGRLRLSRAPGGIRLFVAALLALNVVSMVDAFDTGIALRFAGITAYLAVLALWLATWMDTQRRARIVIVAWLVAALISAALAVLAYAFPIPGRELLLGDGASRARALFKDPNVYGPFLIPVAVIVLQQRIRPRLLRLPGWASAAIVTLLLLGILVSFSRASWLNFALATGVMLAASGLTRRGGARAMRTLIILVVAAVTVVGVLGATGSLEFLEQRAQVQSYDSDRFGAQRAGYELGWRYPVGVGPGQFQFHHDVESHSAYVRVLAEQGFVGLAAWVALLLSTLVLAARATVRGDDTFGIGSSALLGAWCGLALNSAVVDTLHWRHLWLVAALIWAGAVQERGRQGVATPRRSPRSPLGAAAGGSSK